MLHYLDEDIFRENLKGNKAWTGNQLRWGYHAQVIDLVRMLRIQDEKDVLEMGPLGANIVRGSDTMDFDGQWAFDEKPTIHHDARIIPWPIETGRYDLFIALRVWHHLYPMQKEAFLEARRIARNGIITCPEHEGNGILREEFRKWNDGYSGMREYETPGGWGILYHWRDGHA